MEEDLIEAGLLMVVIAGAIAFQTTVIWAVWNFVGSPAFGWVTLEYWQAFLIGTAIAVVFGGRMVTETVKK